MRVLPLAAVVALFALAPAASAETKHVKFTTPVVIDDQPVINDTKCPWTPAVPATAATPAVPAHWACQTPWTVGELAYMSLERAPERGDAPQSWADAIKRDDLAHAIRNADDFPLLDEQRALIEAAMAATRPSPGILGFVKNVIDPPAPAAPAK